MQHFINVTTAKMRSMVFAAMVFLFPSVAVLSSGGIAYAASQVIVTPTNTQGWSTADTRPGGSVNFISDSSAPGNPHYGALQLTTDATTTAKAQYLHDANTPIANVNELSYSTKQNSASFPAGDPSYQFIVDLNGAAAGGFTTFVYEPYQNGVVVPGTWQSWDVDAGQFWSSRSFTDGTCVVVAGGGGAPFYNLATLKTMCPNAVAIGFGVNIGSNNPSYNVEADLVNFNGTVYNFEPFQTPSDKDQCKKNGWRSLSDQNGTPFKNQGQCVSYFERQHHEDEHGDGDDHEGHHENHQQNGHHHNDDD